MMNDQELLAYIKPRFGRPETWRTAFTGLCAILVAPLAPIVVLIVFFKHADVLDVASVILFGAIGGYAWVKHRDKERESEAVAFAVQEAQRRGLQY